MEAEQRILDRLQIVGLIISTLISIVLIFPANQNPVDSVILGLAVAILFQLFDHQIRYRETESRLLQANNLSRSLYEDQWLLEHIQKIVQGYQSVKRGWFWWYQDCAKDAVIQCRKTLRLLEEGSMIADPKSVLNFGVEVSRKAEKSIKAVDLGPDVFLWWRSTEGQEYIQSNAQVIQRKGKVTRVFIQPMNVLREGIDVLEKQARMGIEVYVAHRDELPKELCQDYLIIDDRIFSYTEFTDSGEPREERISINQGDVQRVVKNFDSLIRRARKLDDIICDLKPYDKT